MSNSSLVDYTKISPNKTKRQKKISKITIHHMAGNLTVETCGEVFQPAERKASSNYGVGTDGRVGMYVPEDYRSWASSSSANDEIAVTIEVANDGGANWHVSDRALQKTIELCADICIRNDIERLNFTGDKSGNLTMHKWFAATSCPGAYLESKFQYIADEVNKLITKGVSGMGLYSVSLDGNKNVSKNFKVKEFACNDGSDNVIIDEKLVDILQKIRDHFGVPVTINSAYRTAEYNAKIGGVSNSQHTKGTAADIDVKGISPKQVAQYAEYLMPDMGGIGEYETFTHVDVRGARSRWQNFGSEVVVSGFPGYEEPKVELASANDIIWELMNGALKVEILDVPRALEHLEQAKAEGSSLYWILRKIVNK